MRSFDQFVESSSKIIKDELNPKFWDGKELKEDVRKASMRIAKYYANWTDIPMTAVEDIHLVGGNASYLYNDKSDLDIHLIVDKDKVSECGELLDDYLRSKKKLWTFEHDVKIYGTEVEIYAEDVSDPKPAAQGRYSIKNDEWITQPSREIPKIDDAAVVSKVKNLAGEIDDIIDDEVANESRLQFIKKKLFNLRRQSLSEGGEFALGNLVFKSLRNKGYIDKLNDYMTNVTDKNLSLYEWLDIEESSLTRVMSKDKKGGMAIMSAQRGDKSAKENRARSQQLDKDIRGKGLPGATKVSGRYTENKGQKGERKVGERSHVISSGKMGKKRFAKAIKSLGKKYNQDSVLLKKKTKGDAALVGTNKSSFPGYNKRMKTGKMNPGKTGEFDTKVKNKTFTYESTEEGI